jgi:single-strand DNA-binding protein
MAGMNNVSLVGRLTKEPELRKTQSGTSYLKFTVAVDRMKKEDGADFILCSAWRQQAEFIEQYSDKGTLIGVTGHITTGSYEDRATGKKVFTTEVTADRVCILESKKARAEYPNSGTSYTMADASAHANESFDTGESDGVSYETDDLPF